MGEIEDKAKGRGKQIKGSVTGSDKEQAEGQLQEKKGEAKGAFERVKEKARELTDEDRA